RKMKRKYCSTENLNENKCSSKFCNHQAMGMSPLTGLPFCEQHLTSELEKVKKRRTDLLEKLETVIAESERRSLRLEQQALATELQEVADMFDAAQERLQQWRDRLMSRVQEVHDAVAERLRDASQAEECAKEVKDENSQVEDCGKLFASVESWLDEACSQSEKFSQQRVELRNRQSRQLDDQAAAGNVFRCVGDVAAGVEQLQFEIDRHLTGVMRQCWLDDREASPVLRPSGSISDLPSGPRYLALCNNTRGFAADPSGRIVRADASNEACEPLPDVCVIASFELNTVAYLLLISLKSDVRLRCETNLNWARRIYGLQCDSKRQHVYVAQAQAVTVIDLSGTVIRSVSKADFVSTVGPIRSIDSSSDKLFVLATDPYRLFCFCKDSWQCELLTDLSELTSSCMVNSFSVHGSKILLCDRTCGRILRVCGISGQLLKSYTLSGEVVDSFYRTLHLVLSNCGLLFVSDLKHHVVKVMKSSGPHIQTVGTPGQCGQLNHQFNGPAGIVITSDMSSNQLFVADSNNKRVCIFELTFM
ncbi:hypothetical protein BOX15_Mlig003511g1, partial [Macrostomum lignano]